MPDEFSPPSHEELSEQKLAQAAFAYHHALEEADDAKKIRAERAYLFITLILAPDEVTEPVSWLQFATDRYQELTGSSFQFFEVIPKSERLYQRRVAASFRPTGKYTYAKTTDEELIDAILNHDPKVEFIK